MKQVFDGPDATGAPARAAVRPQAESSVPDSGRASPSISRLGRVWRAWCRLPRSLQAGLVMLGVLCVIALLAGVLFEHDPFDMVGPSFLPPGADPQFPLGTDMLGRDIAAGMAYGARVTLIIGFTATLMATCVGTAIGMTAGFLGGWVDHVLMRLTELFQVIPHFLFAIILVSILGSTLENIVVAIGLTSWTMVARLARAETLSLRERDYVRFCSVMGGSTWRVLTVHILPNAIPPVIAAASILTALAVLTEAGLAFLGMSDSNRMSWGAMVGSSRDALLNAPYMTLLPGAAIVFAVAAFSLIGDGAARLLREGART